MFTLPLFAPESANAASYIQWRPTHNVSWNYSQSCRLQSEKITVTLHPFFADVEEEATIQTIGSLYNGDSKSLEIFGEFQLAEGAALRSMLLWNGDKILKAKLRDRNEADSLYEEVVGREKPRDPAIINWIGNNNYEFKIYPVEFNKERRIRILYSIPVTPSEDGIHFTVKPAFATGAAENPTSIPVKVKGDTSLTNNAILSYGSTKKPIVNGATYSVPQSEFYESSYYDYNTNQYVYNGGTIGLVVNNKASAKASSSVIAAGLTAGYYTGIITEAPQEFKTIVERDIVENHAIQTIIETGGESFINDNVSLDAPVGVYLKTSAPWVGLIKWNVYNPSTGKQLFTYEQRLTPELDTVNSPVVPPLWAAKYSLTTKNGDLGGLYGFVDQRMSLLALEADSLRSAEAALYETSGVPLLNASDIIVDVKKTPQSSLELCHC